MLGLKSGPKIAAKTGIPAGLLFRRIWYSVWKSGVLGITEYRQGRPLQSTLFLHQREVMPSCSVLLGPLATMDGGYGIGAREANRLVVCGHARHLHCLSRGNKVCLCTAPCISTYFVNIMCESPDVKSGPKGIFPITIISNLCYLRTNHVKY